MIQEILAQFVGAPLQLNAVAKLKDEFELTDQERGLLQFKLAEDGYMHVFGHGIVTFFGIPEPHIATLTKKVYELGYGGEEMKEDMESERYVVIIDPDQPESVDFEFIRITNGDPEKIRLISEALAQSMMFDILERRIDTMLARFENMHANLAKTGKLDARASNIMRMIGNNGSITHFIVTKLAFLDKPDITWEEKEYEVLFIKLRKEFDLDERFRALKFRLEFVQDTSELVLDMLSTWRGEVLEIIIIVLIAMEFLFFVFG